MIAYLLTLIATAQAGSQLLPRGMELSWALGDQKDITFTLTIPAVNVTSYDWWGVTFQKKKEKSSKGDMIIISKEKGVIDGFMNGNKKPKEDKKKNLTDASLKLEGDSYVATWTRLLKNKDSKDMKLEVGKSYKIMWFFGVCSDTGDMLPFEKANSGKATIKIEEEVLVNESARKLQFLSKDEDESIDEFNDDEARRNLQFLGDKDEIELEEEELEEEELEEEELEEEELDEDEEDPQPTGTDNSVPDYVSITLDMLI